MARELSRWKWLVIAALASVAAAGIVTAFAMPGSANHYDRTSLASETPVAATDPPTVTNVPTVRAPATGQLPYILRYHTERPGSTVTWSVLDRTHYLRDCGGCGNLTIADGTNRWNDNGQTYSVTPVSSDHWPTVSGGLGPIFEADIAGFVRTMEARWGSIEELPPEVVDGRMTRVFRFPPTGGPSIRQVWIDPELLAVIRSRTTESAWLQDLPFLAPDRLEVGATLDPALFHYSPPPGVEEARCFESAGTHLFGSGWAGVPPDASLPERLLRGRIPGPPGFYRVQDLPGWNLRGWDRDISCAVGAVDDRDEYQRLVDPARSITYHLIPDPVTPQTLWFPEHWITLVQRPGTAVPADARRGTSLRAAGHDAWAWVDGSPGDESETRRLTWSDGNVLLAMEADPDTPTSELLKVAEALTPP